MSTPHHIVTELRRTFANHIEQATPNLPAVIVDGQVYIGTRTREEGLFLDALQTFGVNGRDRPILHAVAIGSDQDPHLNVLLSPKGTTKPTLMVDALRCVIV